MRAIRYHRTMRHAAFALCFALAACGPGEVTPSAGAPPVAATETAPAPARSPRFDPGTLNARCMAVARRQDTDPDVIAADQRICDCLGRTLKPADFNTMISFMELDSSRPDYEVRVAELHQSYGMSDNQFATEINRIRRAGGDCRR
jgi:hypothetical protein